MFRGVALVARVEQHSLAHTLYQGIDQRPGSLAGVAEGPGGVDRLPRAHGRLRGRRHLVILYTSGDVKEDISVVRIGIGRHSPDSGKEKRHRYL